jgi:hypothetical protein
LSRRRLGVAALGLGAAVLGAWLWRVRTNAAGPLIAQIPHEATTVVGVDVAALRRTGVLDRLSGPRELESPEYRKFIADSGFDYRQDLDYAVAGLSAEGNYFALRGRFSWPKLELYARSNGGTCSDGVCRLQTDSGKNASFRLRAPNLLTVSVGRARAGGKNFQAPSGIAWAVVDRPPPLFEGAAKLQFTAQVSAAGLTARILAECADAAAPPLLAARLEAALRSFPGRLAKGRVTASPNGVEVSWALDAASIAALTESERD